MAAKIRTQPDAIFSVRCSPKTRQLNRTPNTDSRERKRDAKEDGTYFSPKFCSRNATIVLKSPRYKRETTTLLFVNNVKSRGASAKGAIISPKMPDTKN